MAIESIKERIETGSVCVAILADRGERYLDTIYSDEWVLSHFGEVSHLWEAGSPYPHEVAAKEKAVEACL
jgi:cysteine synthase A